VIVIFASVAPVRMNALWEEARPVSRALTPRTYAYAQTQPQERAHKATCPVGEAEHYSQVQRKHQVNPGKGLDLLTGLQKRTLPAAILSRDEIDVWPAPQHAQSFSLTMEHG
jgi:hypothetical protein